MANESNLLEALRIVQQQLALRASCIRSNLAGGFWGRGKDNEQRGRKEVFLLFTQHVDRESQGELIEVHRGRTNLNQ